MFTSLELKTEGPCHKKVTVPISFSLTITRRISGRQRSKVHRKREMNAGVSGGLLANGLTLLLRLELPVKPFRKGFPMRLQVQRHPKTCSN